MPVSSKGRWLFQNSTRTIHSLKFKANIFWHGIEKVTFLLFPSIHPALAANLHWNGFYHFDDVFTNVWAQGDQGGANLPKASPKKRGAHATINQNCTTILLKENSICKQQVTPLQHITQYWGHQHRCRPSNQSVWVFIQLGFPLDSPGFLRFIHMQKSRICNYYWQVKFKLISEWNFRWNEQLYRNRKR